MGRIRILPCSAAFVGLLQPLDCRAEEPFFDGGFKAACEKASETKRVVLIDFYTTWCLPCRKLDQTTWKEKAVLAWLKDRCVCLKVDAEKEEELAKRYKIASFPTTLLLKPDGSELDRLVGYRGPADFLSEAKDTLAWKDSITQAKENLKLFDELRAKKAKNVGEFFEQVVDLLIEKWRYRDVVEVGVANQFYSVTCHTGQAWSTIN